MTEQNETAPSQEQPTPEQAPQPAPVPPTPEQIRAAMEKFAQRKEQALEQFNSALVLSMLDPRTKTINIDMSELVINLRTLTLRFEVLLLMLRQMNFPMQLFEENCVNNLERQTAKLRGIQVASPIDKAVNGAIKRP